MSDKRQSQNAVLEGSSKSSSVSQDQAFTVVKRDGTLVPFRPDRIFRALELAFRDTKKLGKVAPLPSEIAEAAQKVTDQIVKQLVHLATKGACLTVEGIQDLVEVTLMKSGFHDVARDYIIYRDQHKAQREDSITNHKIVRKDGQLVRFNPMKITSTLENVFRLTHHIEGQTPQEIIDAVNILTQKLVSHSHEVIKQGQQIDTQFIQDEIENLLMNEKHFRVAKTYILYRQEKEKAHASITISSLETPTQRVFNVKRMDGSEYKFTEEQLRNRLRHATRGLGELVSADELLEATTLNFYDGIKESEVDMATIMAARTKIEIEPAYSKVASRLLLDVLFREACGLSTSEKNLKEKHKAYFKKYLKRAIAIERVHPALLDFDLDTIADAMILDRDDKFTYLGLQTLYDRYFIHDNGQRLEPPQIFWMRVAMGLALNEGEQKTSRAIEFYNILSTFLFTSGTPTLFNSGTPHSQLSSCYLSTVMDDLAHIFKVVADDAQLSKWAGGIGNDWSNVRATGARIKGTNGKSQGVIPFLKVANDTAVAVNQCFDPDTRVYTDQGIKSISDIQIGDLVLGISGLYRKVTEKYAYKQQDPMVSLEVTHSLGPIHVTSGHPFYAIPAESIQKGCMQGQWIEANNLKAGDYVAQVIPKETVAASDCNEEDARFYGILLGIAELSRDGREWSIAGNPTTEAYIEFVKAYLSKKGLSYSQIQKNPKEVEVRFASSFNAVKEGTTGLAEKGLSTFEYSDLFDTQASKHISKKFAHLPRPQAHGLVQGLLETSAKPSPGGGVCFTHNSLSLVEDLRYQLLRLGIPSTGKFCKQKQSKRKLHIPITASIAQITGCKQETKKNWLETASYLFTRVKKKSLASTSPVVFDLKVEEDESYMTTSALAHNGGKRKGAMCAYLETWHLDIEDFLELRKNTGDERRRTHDMNTANWIPDLFMKRVYEGGMWTLFSPSDVPDLHDLYGHNFEKRYTEYEKMTESGKIKLFKKVEALQLWRKMLSMLFETGHPWITFKDPSNIRSPQDHKGVVHSSNLCTEILLNTSAEETAVCNLGSINLVEHMTPEGLNKELLANTIRTVVRMLDNVIDINFYPTAEARNSNLRHRPIGLGLMGFQDALYIMNISYASHEAIEFADRSMELIAYYAILASSELAKERGTYESYKGSKWDRGFLPQDTIDLLEKERGGHLEMNRTSTLDWEVVRDHIKKWGMRNSNTMAIAPTATISNITGVTQSIEPMYSHLFVKSNLSGEFTIPNLYLVEKLKTLGIWDEEMLDDLKYFDGSIKEIARIPDEIKRLFLTSFEIDPEWIIECASRRQKWLDMGQSLNLYLEEPSGKKLHQMYLLAWTKGLKTTYYLRTKAATQIEKSTTDINKRGLQPRWMKNKSASSNVQIERDEAPKLKACSLEEGCESCQ